MLPLACCYLQAQHLDAAALQLLLPTAQQLASTGRLSGCPAAHCLANLAQLLTGCDALDRNRNRSGNQQLQEQSGSGGSKGSSGMLSAGLTAELFVRAAMQLLVAAKASAAQPSNSAGAVGDSAAVLQQGCWVLCTQQHLLQLQGTLMQRSQQGLVLWAGYCVHLLQDTQAAAANGRSRQAGTAGAGRQALSSGVLNVLAFAPRLLPSLWDWLARTAGLPLEAPLQASRGLDIAGGAMSWWCVWDSIEAGGRVKQGTRQSNGPAHTAAGGVGDSITLLHVVKL